MSDEVDALITRLLEEDDQLTRRLQSMPAIDEVVSSRPVGGVIRLLRVTSKLTLADLAERSGLPDTFLQKIEEEAEELDFEHLKRLAAALDLRAAHLMITIELAQAVCLARLGPRPPQLKDPS